MIETTPVTVQPPPIVVNNVPTVPYVAHADTMIQPSGVVVIVPADSGYIAEDSTAGNKVMVRVHVHKNAAPTISVVASPAPATAFHTDTVSGKIQNIKEPLSTFEIVLMTAGGLAILALVAYAVGTFRP